MLFVFAVAACGTAVAGCGGSGSGSQEIDTAALAPSRAGYISQADGLCGFYQDRTERQGRETLGLGAGDFRLLDSGAVIFKPGRRPPDAAISGFVAEVAVPNLTDELGELRALVPPRGDERALSAIYDSTEQAAQRLAADPTQSLDPARMAALFNPPLKLARGYGFRICGARPPTVPA